MVARVRVYYVLIVSQTVGERPVSPHSGENWLEKYHSLVRRLCVVPLHGVFILNKLLSQKKEEDRERERKVGRGGKCADTRKVNQKSAVPKDVRLWHRGGGRLVEGRRGGWGKGRMTL